jgi:hypothetical protein
VVSNNLTSRELDNILITYGQYGADHLGDFIRAIWKEAYDEGHEIGYKTGVVEGFQRWKVENGKR